MVCNGDEDVRGLGAGLTPKNSGAETPAMVNGLPLIRNRLPDGVGSAAKRRCQYP